MIQPIRLQSLRNGEYIQLLKDVNALVAEQNPVALQLEAAYTGLQAEVVLLDELFKLAQGNLITDELIALDARRDAALTGLQSLINGFTYSTNPDTAQAARLLQANLSLFGSNIARDNYQSQTTTMRNIIDDWRRDAALQNAATQLGLSGFVQEMEAANNLFEAKYIERAKALAGVTPESIGLRRESANAAYYRLRDRINAFWTIQEGAEPYQKLIDNINSLVNFYINLINRRIGQSGSNPEETTPILPESA